MKYCWCSLFILPLLFLLTSCSEEVRYAHTLQEAKFTKKINASLVLKRGKKRLDYVSGKPGQTMLFLLQNTGLQQAKIDEWFMNEAENIRLYYARCEKGKSAALKKSDFILAWPDEAAQKKAPGRRSPMCLNPNNSVLIEAPMDFLRKFEMTKPVETVAIRAELNLNTVSAETAVFEVDIRPIVIQY